MKKKLLVWGITMAVAVTMLFGGTVSVFAAETTTANVEVTVQMGDTFQVAHKNLEVKSDMAEEYGYTDNVTDGISALDALVAAHIDKYGADKATINSKLTMAGGNPTLMMGEAAASGFSGFSVNEGYVKDANGWGAVVDSAEVKSGDRVDFFWYEDPNWGDYITVFKDGNDKVFSKEVKTGEDVKLYLDGYLFMMGYDDNVYHWPVKNANICLVDENGKAVPMTDGDKNVTTDENGNVVLSFEEAGTYYVTATQGGFDYKPVMTWCQITVIEDAPVVPEEPTEPTDPVAPVDPADPADPQDTVDQTDKNDTATTAAAKEDKTDDAVKTGDSFNIPLFAGIMVLAAAGALTTVFVRRKES